MMKSDGPTIFPAFAPCSNAARVTRSAGNSDALPLLGEWVGVGRVLIINLDEEMRPHYTLLKNPVALGTAASYSRPPVEDNLRR